jgi:hypothetical protein
MDCKYIVTPFLSQPRYFKRRSDRVRREGYIYMQAGPGGAGTVEELQHGTVQAVIQSDQTTEVSDQVTNQSEDNVNMSNV